MHAKYCGSQTALVLRAANNGFKKQINAGQLKISSSKRGGVGGEGDCSGCVIVLFVSEVKKALPWTTALAFGNILSTEPEVSSFIDCCADFRIYAADIYSEK